VLGVINAIRQHFIGLGNKHLSLSEDLRIEVLDIDLGGQYEWWRFPFDARIMRDVTAPTIKVRY
jgi:hypothetical protein